MFSCSFIELVLNTEDIVMPSVTTTSPLAELCTSSALISRFKSVNFALMLHSRESAPSVVHKTSVIPVRLFCEVDRLIERAVYRNETHLMNVHYTLDVFRMF